MDKWTEGKTAAGLAGYDTLTGQLRVNRVLLKRSVKVSLVTGLSEECNQLFKFGLAKSSSGEDTREHTIRIQAHSGRTERHVGDERKQGTKTPSR